MYDRLTESWWQEFNGEAIVGDMTGQQLEFLPMAMVSWKEFKESYPDGKVLSRPAVYDRPYGKNPFVTYDTRGNEFFSNIAENRSLIEHNYKMMQLYAPQMSIQSKTHVKESIENFECEFNKTEIIGIAMTISATAAGKTKNRLNSTALFRL